MNPNVAPQACRRLIAFFRCFSTTLFGDVMGLRLVRLRVAKKVFGCLKDISPDGI